MKKILETELLDFVNQLREFINVVSDEEPEDKADLAKPAFKPKHPFIEPKEKTDPSKFKPNSADATYNPYYDNERFTRDVVPKEPAGQSNSTMVLKTPKGLKAVPISPNARVSEGNNMTNTVSSMKSLLHLIEASDKRADTLNAIGGSEHPMQGISDYMNKGKDNVNNAIGDLASSIGHSIGDPLINQGPKVAKEIARGIGQVGKGAYNNIADHVNKTFSQDNKDWGIDRFGGGINPMPKPRGASVNAGDAPDIANSMLNKPEPFSMPKPEMHQFNPSDTSYAQDHPSSFIPPEDKDGGLSDLDKAPLYREPPTAKPQHPAGKPKATAKFDPSIQKIQYELRAKGYPVSTNGVLDNKTQQAIEWERASQERDSRITGYDELKADMDQSIAEPEPFDNTQGDFDRTPEINESQDTELTRIMQIAQWR